MKQSVLPLIGCGVMIISLTGCAIGPVKFDPVESNLDNKRFDDRVDYYQKRGLDPKSAHQRAFEDDVIWYRDR
jgi:hypothetical protein